MQALVSSLVILTMATTLVCPAFAETELPGEAESAAEALERAKELINTEGKYGQAIEILRTVIAREEVDLEILRSSYLQLIAAHIYAGRMDRQTDPDTDDRHFTQARESIQACLQNPDLRDTVPDPPAAYPTEMIIMFAKVRGEMFGAFRVLTLEPADAVVAMDGDTLIADPDLGYIDEQNVPTGSHLVVVSREGYRQLSEEITIAPSSTLEKEYELDKGCGWLCWILWGGGAAAVATVIVALLPNDGPEATEPLPPPPDPPGI